MKIAFLADTKSIHSRRWIESIKQDNELLVLSPSSIPIPGIKQYNYIQKNKYNRLSKRIQGSFYIYMLFINRSALLSRLLIKFLGELGFNSDKIVDEIKRFDPDIIHLHYLSRWDDMLALLILPKEKTIISVWGDDIEVQTRKHPILFKLIRKKLLQTSKVVTATSGYLAELTFQYAEKKSFPIVIPFGVDINNFSPVKLKSKKLVIGFVKPTELVYGSDILLSVVSILKKKKMHFELWVVGGETEEFRVEAQRLGVLNNIKFFGHISHDEVSKIIPDFSAMLLPSRFETFGVSAIEAQACGVPVIASRVGGLAEVINDGETGKLINGKDPSDYVNALLEVVNDRASYSQKGRIWASEKFNWNSNVSLMTEIYGKVKAGAKTVVMSVTNSAYLDNRVRKEATALSDGGFLVTVFGMLEPGEILPIWESADKYTVIRIPKDISLGKGGLKALFRKALHLPEIILYGGASISKLHKSIREYPADVFHAHDLDTLLISALSARRNGSKLVYDAHELFVKAMVDSINEKKRNNKYKQFIILWIIRLNLAMVERLFINQASIVLTVSNSISEFLNNKYELTKKPSLILNAWEKEISPRKKNLLRERLNISKFKLILLYQGGIIEGRGLESLVYSVPKLPTNMVVVFLGYGKLMPKLKDIVKKNNLTTRVYFLDAVPATELMDFTSSADIGLIVLEATNLNNIYAMPNKLFEYLAAGLAIVTPDYPDMGHVMGEGAGITYQRDNWNDLVRAIIEIADPAKLAIFKKRSKELFMTKYNWDIEKKKLVKIYRDLFV